MDLYSRNLMPFDQYIDTYYQPEDRQTDARKEETPLPKPGFSSIIARQERILHRLTATCDLTPSPSFETSQRVEHIIKSIEKLNANFNWALGSVVLKTELRQPPLQEILATLQAPLSTQARELRQRAEYAYQNGWYDDALVDFLQAEKQNYQDFSVYQALGNIYLYHRRPLDLNNALHYYLKAGKYATPRSTYHAAIGYLFASFVYYLLKDDEAAIQHAFMATQLYPKLSEAFFSHAKFAAVAGKADLAIQSLETAIRAERNYAIKAWADQDFAAIEAPVVTLLTKLYDEAKDQAYSAVKNLEQELKRYTFHEKSVEINLLNLLEQARKLLSYNTYFDFLDVSEPIQAAQKLLQQGRATIISKVQHRILHVTKDYVHGMAFSPDGSLLATGAGDKTIKLWSIKTGQVIQILKGHSDLVGHVSFSPDGLLLASSSNDKTLKLWNVKTGQLIRTLQKNSDVVDNFAFSPNGSQLICGLRYSTIKLVDVSTGQAIYTLKDVDLRSNVILSNDGTLTANVAIMCISVEALSHVIQLRNAMTGEIIRILQGHADTIQYLAFSPDGSLLASASTDQTVKLWNIKTGQLIRTLQAHPEGASGVAFSPDSALLATNGAKAVKLWNVKTGQNLYTEDYSHSTSSMRTIFSPSDSCLLATMNVGDIRLWNLSYQVMPKDLTAATIQDPSVEAQHYFLEAQNEEEKQKKKWFGRDYSGVLLLYEQAAALGHKEAGRQAEALRQKNKNGKK